MFTVALVGLDGSGKTTIAQMLRNHFPAPMKYIYMGTSIQSSNIALPTSRLMHYLKRRRYRKEMRRTGVALPEVIASHHLQQARPVQRGTVGALLQVLHRVAEEWYRQVVAWCYQWRGYVVLYDRHFLFEYNPASVEESTYIKFPASYRLHLWLLDRCYPRPNLVIFLDAPPEVLLGRKQEWKLEHLQRYRQDLIRQGETMKNFVTVNVTRPLDDVLVDVTNLIMRFRA